MTEINVDSPEDINRILANFSGRFPDEVSAATAMELSKVLVKSKRICPFDTGYLRGSGNVGDPVVTPFGIQADIGYSAEYAWWVHELIDNYHKPPTQAKYLEVPLMEALPRLEADIARRALSLLGSVEGAGTEE